MDGILLVRQVNEKEIRFLFSTYFGMSVFDYSLRGDSFFVNNCIAPLRNKHVEALMANDFRILFTGNTSDSLSNTLKPVEKRTEGRGFLKSKVTINGTSAGNPDSVRIHHPLLRLTMHISRSDDMLQEDEPEEIQDSITDPGV